MGNIEVFSNNDLVEPVNKYGFKKNLVLTLMKHLPMVVENTILVLFIKIPIVEMPAFRKY